VIPPFPSRHALAPQSSRYAAVGEARLSLILLSKFLGPALYTGRNVGADEAEKLGLINFKFGAFSGLTVEVRKIAQTIAAKSPLAVRGIKETMNYSRDHSVADGLMHVADRNAATLLSADLAEAITAQQEKRAPRFED